MYRAVISWSMPSYIPQAYPIIRYEIGYHVLDNCSMADVDDINIQVLNHSNVSSDSTSLIWVMTLVILLVYVHTVSMDQETGQLLLIRHFN